MKPKKTKKIMAARSCVPQWANDKFSLHMNWLRQDNDEGLENDYKEAEYAAIQ